MSDLDFDLFSKKYSFAINGLKMRLKDDKKKSGLAKKLYDDSLSNSVNMNDLNRSLELFYQGNIFGQVEMSKYIDKYNK